MDAELLQVIIRKHVEGHQAVKLLDLKRSFPHGDSLLRKIQVIAASLYKTVLLHFLWGKSKVIDLLRGSFSVFDANRLRTKWLIELCFSNVTWHA